MSLEINNQHYLFLVPYVPTWIGFDLRLKIKQGFARSDLHTRPLLSSLICLITLPSMTFLIVIESISKLIVRLPEVRIIPVKVIVVFKVGLFALATLALLIDTQFRAFQDCIFLAAISPRTALSYLGSRGAPGSDEESNESQDNLHVDGCPQRSVDDTLTSWRTAIRFYRLPRLGLRLRLRSSCVRWWLLVRPLAVKLINMKVHRTKTYNQERTNEKYAVL